jgi:hypothetical protein
MDTLMQQRLLDFLKTSFDTDGTLHFLATTAKKIDNNSSAELFKLRVAVTYRNGNSVIPYFDGTEMYIEVSPHSIQFAREHEWADGPPLMEGSPNEMALPWVSELAPPLYVSQEAREAVNMRNVTSGQSSSVDVDQLP